MFLNFTESFVNQVNKVFSQLYWSDGNASFCEDKNLTSDATY